MRKINKSIPLESFSDFTKKYPDAVWGDFSKPGSSGHACYLDTRSTILIEEQDCVCGYSEIPIEDERDCHVDHFRKRSMFPEKTFDWDNLIAASNDEDFGAKFKDNKSGITKQDYLEFLNPVVDMAQEYFYYNERGEIEAHPALLDNSLKLKVEKTIRVFNLQDKSLVNRRKTLIEQLRSYSGLSSQDLFNAMKFGGFTSLLEQYIVE